MNSSSTLSVTKRMDAAASKAGICVGPHNHSWTSLPDEISRPADFEAAIKGYPEHIGINLDVGHLLAASYDPVSFVEKHHDRIKICT